MLSIFFLALWGNRNQVQAYEITDYIDMESDIVQNQAMSVWQLLDHGNTGIQDFECSPYWYGVEYGDNLLGIWDPINDPPSENRRNRQRFSPIGGVQDLPQEVAYAVYLEAERANSTTNYQRDEYNLTANIVYDIMGLGSKNTYVNKNNAEYKELYNKAKAHAVVKNSNNVSIIKSGSLVVENPSSSINGTYGPFQVVYPSYNGNFVGTKLVVTLNKGTANEKVLFKIENGVINNNLYNATSIPGSGEEFYLSEEDGIIYGAENKITVDYEGALYTGKYRVYTMYYWGWLPLIQRTFACDRCYASKTFDAWGWWPATVATPITSGLIQGIWLGVDDYDTIDPTSIDPNDVWIEQIASDQDLEDFANNGGRDSGQPWWDGSFGKFLGDPNLEYEHQRFNTRKTMYDIEYKTTFVYEKKDEEGTVIDERTYTEYNRDSCSWDSYLQTQGFVENTEKRETEYYQDWNYYWAECKDDVDTTWTDYFLDNSQTGEYHTRYRFL